MNAANQQLAAIKSLSQKQADAIAALDAATTDRLNAISVATQQGIINLYQVGNAQSGWDHQAGKMQQDSLLLSTDVVALAKFTG